jgi:hypothetical protein
MAGGIARETSGNTALLLQISSGLSLCLPVNAPLLVWQLSLSPRLLPQSAMQHRLGRRLTQLTTIRMGEICSRLQFALGVMPEWRSAFDRRSSVGGSRGQLLLKRFLAVITPVLQLVSFQLS